MSATMSYGVRRKRWNALQRLRAMRALLLSFDLLLLLVVLNAATEQRTALERIAERDVPAATAAERIEISLKQMEEASAEEMLETPAHSRAAFQMYEDRRSEVVRALLQAIQSSPDQAVGESSLETLQLGLGTYERLVGVSRDLHSRSERGATTAYEEAESYMQDKLLPAAIAVEITEVQGLKASFKAQRRTFRFARLLFMFGCGAELFLLLLVQISLSRQTQRTFNLALLCATLLLLVTAVHLSTRLGVADAQFAQLEENTLPSVQTLWRVRDSAYTADLDLSRELSDPTHRRGNEHAYVRDCSDILSVPPTLTPDQLKAALREGRSVDGFSGLLAEAMIREDPSGNEETLLSAMSSWEGYVSQGGEVEKLERTGQLEKAVQLYEDMRFDQSQGALARFDQELQAALKSEQIAMDAALAHRLADVRRVEIEGGAATAVLAALVIFGFAPRLREYR